MNYKAFWRMIEGKGYNYSERRTLWKSRKTSWCFIYIQWGIRRSEIRQYFPVWNVSNNNCRALLFGLGFRYFEIGYQRAGAYAQWKWLPFKRRLFRFYRLLF